MTSAGMYLFHYMLAIPMVGSTIKSVQANLHIEGMIDHHWMLLTFALLLLSTLPICYLTYVLIEKPFMNLRGRSKKTLTMDKPQSVGIAVD